MSENNPSTIRNHPRVIAGLVAGAAAASLASVLPFESGSPAPDQSSQLAPDSTLVTETPSTFPALSTSVEDAIATNTLPPVIVQSPRGAHQSVPTLPESTTSTTEANPMTQSKTVSVPTTTIPEVVDTTPGTNPETTADTTPEDTSTNFDTTPILFPVIPDTIPEITPETTPDTIGTDYTTPEVILKQLTQYEVTPEVAAIMKADTVRIPSLGCSGMLIHDAAGATIGISTAEHCYLRDTLQPRVQGTDGKTYIVMPNGVDAYTGDTLDTLNDVGQITQFMVNPAGDLNKDMSYGAFAGHSLEEVMAADNKLPTEVIHTLQQGDVMYMSGWPGMQPENSGLLRRQEFAMTILGTQVADMTTGESIKVLWAAVPKNKDGSICSFGASGSEGFILANGKKQSVGNLAAFNDLVGGYYNNEAGAAAAKTYYEYLFGVDLTGMAGVCGFAYETPDTPVSVVQNSNQIPGQEQPDGSAVWEQIMTESRANFFDSNYTRTVIDGVVGLSLSGGKGTELTFIDRPVIFFNKETGQTLISEFVTKGQDNLALIPVDDMSTIAVFDRDTVEGIDMLQSTGALQLTTSEGGILPDGFTDPNGITIARPISFDLSGKQQYQLGFDADGNLQAIPAVTGK